MHKKAAQALHVAFANSPMSIEVMSLLVPLALMLNPY